MPAHFGTRLLGIGVNLQLLLIVIDKFPVFLENDILMAILILNIIASLCIHSTDLLLLVMIEQPILTKLWLIVSSTGDDNLKTLFIIGCIVHMIIIKNKMLVNML